MYPANGFSIDSLFPAGKAGLWVAEFAFTSDSELIRDTTVAHNMRIKVRFEYAEDGSVEGLIEAAYEQARRVLNGFAEVMNTRTLSDAREAARLKSEEQNKPIDWNNVITTPPPSA